MRGEKSRTLLLKVLLSLFIIYVNTGAVIRSVIMLVLICRKTYQICRCSHSPPEKCHNVYLKTNTYVKNY